MDDMQFDRISRAVGAATSRRGAFAAAVGAAVGAALGLGRVAAVNGSRGRERPAAAGPCGDGSPAANRCRRNGDCCTRVCNRRVRRCRCIQRGRACNVDANCCNQLSCVKGVCGRDGGGDPCDLCKADETCVGGACVPACRPASCPAGCCQDGVCQSGASDDACGVGGGVCNVCGLGETCQGGACVYECDRMVGAAVGGLVTDTTIQDAIDAAPDGGRVCIQAGSYTGLASAYIATITKNLTIEGEDQATVIIDGQTTYGGIVIGLGNYSSAITVSISGLTVQNGRSSDGGAVMVWGNVNMIVNMTDVTVRDSTGASGVMFAANAIGAGATYNATRVTLTGNDVRPNTGRGGGLALSGNAVLTDCDITSNSVGSQGGGVMVLAGSSLTMTGGSISGNHAYQSGGDGFGGAFMGYYDYVSPATISLTNVEVTNNVADGSGGVGSYEGQNTTVTMTGCTVTGNTGANCSCVWGRGPSTYSCITSFCS